MPETIGGGDDHGQVGDTVVPLRNVPAHLVVVLAPVQGGGCVSPVTIVDRIKVKRRHCALTLVLTLISYSTQLIVVVLYQLTKVNTKLVAVDFP